MTSQLKNERGKSLLPLDLNHGPLEWKVSVLPMSCYADPLVVESILDLD